jgi:dihydrofolate synthase/folylpolyglutamate synthase
LSGDALSRIRSRGHIGIRLGLVRMQALLARLGDPQAHVRGALVAGTNGKGSVAAMVASVLQAGGYSVAQAPSPHLVSYRERVVIDGRPISASDLDSLLTEVLAASAPGEAEHGPATEFELLTAAAILWSQRRAVDVAVLEVGLGGRLDASNAWDPDVAVVTNIALDHQAYLGDTIEAVAGEKAAIIKRGARAVTGATEPALGVIRARARDVGAALSVVQALAVQRHDLSGLRLHHERLGELQLALLGRHQAHNAAVALGTLDALAAAGVASVDDASVHEGLARTRWPGRLELLDIEGSQILLDGAHNPAGAAALAATIEELRPSLRAGRATLLLGVMQDKEVDAMVAALLASSTLREAHLVATEVPDTDRSLSAADVAAAWSEAMGNDASRESVDDADDALASALRLAAQADGPLIVAGSLYLIGHVRGRLISSMVRD